MAPFLSKKASIYTTRRPAVLEWAIWFYLIATMTALCLADEAEYGISRQAHKINTVFDYSVAHLSDWQNDEWCASIPEFNKFAILREAFRHDTLRRELHLQFSGGRPRHPQASFAHFAQCVDMAYDKIPRRPVSEVPTVSIDATVSEFMHAEARYLRELCSSRIGDLNTLCLMQTERFLDIEFNLNTARELRTIINYFTAIVDSPEGWEGYGKIAAGQRIQFVARHLLVYTEYIRSLTRSRPVYQRARLIDIEQKMVKFTKAVDDSVKAFEDWTVMTNVHLLKTFSLADRRVFRIDRVMYGWANVDLSPGFYALLTPLYVLIGRDEDERPDHKIKLVDWLDISVLTIKAPSSPGTKFMELKEKNKVRRLSFADSHTQRWWFNKLSETSSDED